jgi:hypothetical protein
MGGAAAAANVKRAMTRLVAAASLMGPDHNPLRTAR